MDQRISLITIGVTDLRRARAFYERLGWTCVSWEVAHNPGWTVHEDGSTTL